MTVSIRTSQPSQSASAQPWLRDHYTALRSDIGPVWESTRAVVAPAVAGASQRVRNDMAPAAAQFSTQVAKQALDRSAPLRSEMSNRYTAALAGARGQVTAAQIADLTRARSHRRLWFVGAALAGATLGLAAAYWQRSHNQDWVEDAPRDAPVSNNGRAPRATETADGTQPHPSSPMG